MSNKEDLVWVEKYRPENIDECILPSELKKKLKSFVKKSIQMPHLLMHGTAGVGKTSAAKALMNEINADYIVINASKDRNIDILRTKIQDYASTVSFGEGRKFVILDEADGLSPMVQDALRNFMEEFASNCGFILTCNHLNKIKDALQSRCTLIPFHVKKSDYKEMLSTSLSRFENILIKENITYDKKIVLQHIMNFYPDLRKALNELQAYSNISSNIDSGILSISTGKEIDELVTFLKEKDFSSMRKWVSENDLNMENLIDSLYKKGSKIFEKEKIPFLVLILAKYDYQNAFVGNKEINIVAMLTEIMSDVI